MWGGRFYIRWIRTAMFVSFSFAAVALGAPSVRPVSVSSIDQITNAPLKEAVKQLEIAPIDPKKDPSIPVLYEKVTELLRKLVGPEDNKQPIHLVIADDMDINASFYRIPQNDQRLVTVNLGLLKFVESDDELAYVLGHELEHGNSLLQKEADKAKYELEKTALQRPVEVEADVKSALKRVYERGYNPHGATRFGARLRELFGDVLSTTHPALAARIDAMGLGIANLTRVQGKILNHDRFSKDIVGPFQKQYLETDRFREERLQRIEKIFLKTENPALEAYRKVLSSDVDPGELKEFYKKAFQKDWKEISRLGSNLLDEYAMVDLQVRLHQKWDKQLEFARSQVVKPGFKPSNSRQLHSLLSLDNREYSLSVPDLIKAEIKVEDLQKEIAAIRSDLAAGNATSAQLQELNSKLLSKTRILEQAEKTLKLARYPFRRVDTSSVVPRLKELARMDFLKAEPKYRDEYSLLERELNRLQRDIGAKWKQIARRNTQLIGENPELLFGDELLIRKSDPRWNSRRLKYEIKQESKWNTVISEKLLWFFDLPAQSLTGVSADVFEAYLRNLEGFLKHPDLEIPVSRRVEMVLMSWTLNRGKGNFTYFFRNHVRRNADQAAKDLSRFLSLVTPYASDSRSFEELAGHWYSQLSSVLDAETHYGREFYKSFLKQPWVSGYLSQAGNIALETRPGMDTSRVVVPANRTVRALRELSIFDLDQPLPKTVAKGLDDFTESLARLRLRELETTFPGRFGIQDARALVVLDMPETAWEKLSEPRFLSALRQDLLQLASKAQNPRSELIKVPFEKLFTIFHGKLPREEFFDLIRRTASVLEPYGDLLALSKQQNVSEQVLIDEILEFSKWMQNTHPEEASYVFKSLHFANHQFFSDYDLPADNPLRLDPNPSLVKRFSEESNAFAESRIRYHLQQTGSMSQAAERFWMEVRPRNAIVTGIVYRKAPVIDAVERIIFRPTPRETLEKFNEFMEGSVHAIKKGLTDEIGKVARLDFDARAKQYGMKGAHDPEFKSLLIRYETADRVPLVSIKELLSKPDSLVDVPPETLIKTFTLITDDEGPAGSTDRLFEVLWQKSEGNPELRAKLLQDIKTSQLYYDDSKRKLSLWELDRRFFLSARSAQMRKVDSELPVPGMIRDEVRAIRAEIDRQFPKPSALKNELLEHIENSLLTNSAESRFLEMSKLRNDNWHKDRKVMLVDMIQQFDRGMESSYDRLQLLKYAIGVEKEPPAFVERHFERLGKAMGRDVAGFRLERLKVSELPRLFREAEVGTRIFFLQSLLDTQTGILSEPAILDSLVDLVLGERSQVRPVRTFFLSYLKSLPDTDKKAVLGKILAGFPDSRGKVSLKSGLEAMGPMGVKGGQFGRRSGLAPSEVAAELDDLFDRASPPPRLDALERLERILGDQIIVRQVIGSGSINYVVLADLKDSKTGVYRKVAVRVQRPSAPGQIHNENNVLENAIAEMFSEARATQDSGTRELAEILDEARRHSYRTLGPGGPQLDLTTESKVHELAKLAYETRADPKTGFRIEVIKPDESLRSLIPPEFSTQIDIYEYVPNTSLKALPKTLRAGIAEQIVRAELTAALEHGAFDPDGSPGNWLIDTEAKRIVRIDYPEFDSITPKEREALRKTLATLLDSRTNSKMAITLANQIPFVFSSEAAGGLNDLQRRVERIIARKDFPTANSPQERLFFLRRELQSELSQKAGKPVVIRLNPASRAALTSIAGTKIFAEHIGESAYRRILSEHLGVDMIHLAVDRAKSAVSTKIQNVKQGVRRRCSELFRLLLP